jgi:hypothetical protein
MDDLRHNHGQQIKVVCDRTVVRRGSTTVLTGYKGEPLFRKLTVPSWQGITRGVQSGMLCWARFTKILSKL